MTRRVPAKPRRTASTLAASEQRLRAIIATEPECVKVMSAEGRLLEMNPAGLAMLEADSLAAVQTRPLTEFLLPEHRAGFIALHRKVFAGSNGTLEFEVRGLKGGRRWLETHAAPLRDGDGRVCQLLGITRDITERRQVRESLRAEQRKLRRVLDSMEAFVALFTPDGRVLEVNEAPLRFVGRSREEMLGTRFADGEWWRHSQQVRERVRAILARAAAGENVREDLSVSGAGGEVRIFDAIFAPLRDANGAVVQVVGSGVDITERTEAEGALRESEARFRSLTALSADWYWEQDENLRFVDIGDDAPSSVRAHRVGKTRWDNATDGDEPKWAAHRAQLEKRLPFRDFEYSRTSLDGVLRHVSVSGLPIFDAGGAFKGYRGVGRDISERQAAEAKIRSLNRVYAVLSGINAAIVRIRDRDQLFREACRVAVEQGGFRMAWIGLLDRQRELVRPVASAGAVGDFFDTAPLAVVEARPGGHGLVGRALREVESMVSNDIAGDPQRLMKQECAQRGIHSLAVLPLVVAGEPQGVLALYAGEAGFFDAQEMKLLEELAGDIAFAIENIQKAEKIDHLAYYDALTGLANRALLHERLAQELRALGEGRRFALFVLNIDRFKEVNDAYGRHSGDRVLRKVAQRLREVLGDAASLARTGADTFAVLVPEPANEGEMARLAGRLLAAVFDRPIRIAGGEVRAAGRIGIAAFPDDARDGDALFHRAEAAMKKAKALGERYFFYTRGMSERIAEKLALEGQLRRALENDEFVLHYQPKVSTATRALTGMEALIRWRSPALGLVPPMQFIPLMEETGLILEAGAWALRRAALDHKAWTERGLKPPRVAVNVSPIQLRQRDFVERVEQAIMEGVAPVGIDLEITESLVMQDVAMSIERLARLRSLGVKIAIDDFGTGYSSLAYLARLPVQTLKIDRSFIVSMLEKAETLTLVETIVGLAHSLRLTVVAEGVDSNEQAARLRELGCDEMQGYLFSKPVPFDAMTSLLERTSLVAPSAPVRLASI
jgi:diguanylate cyclase (GGDEF)-like protein/PAS domain S-box-containing protein